MTMTAPPLDSDAVARRCLGFVQSMFGRRWHFLDTITYLSGDHMIAWASPSVYWAATESLYGRTRYLPSWWTIELAAQAMAAQTASAQPDREKMKLPVLLEITQWQNYGRVVPYDIVTVDITVTDPKPGKPSVRRLGKVQIRQSGRLVAEGRLVGAIARATMLNGNGGSVDRLTAPYCQDWSIGSDWEPEESADHAYMINGVVDQKEWAADHFPGAPTMPGNLILGQAFQALCRPLCQPFKAGRTTEQMPSLTYVRDWQVKGQLNPGDQILFGVDILERTGESIEGRVEVHRTTNDTRVIVACGTLQAKLP